MTALQRVKLALGDRIKRDRRDGCTAQCPAHDDRNASLEISNATDRVLLNCHAGCETTDVVAALGLQMSDLFDVQRPASNASARIDCTYEYCDANGIVLYRAVREFPKKFYQQHCDAVGRWRNGRNGIAPVPYRLPELIATVAAQREVLLVEGEKDVDNLRALGFAATTNLGGAGKWTDAESQWLNGAAHVVVVPDNDAPGRAHAITVIESLARLPNPPLVKVLALPTLPEKGDVSDWLAAGGDADALRALIDAAPAHAPSDALHAPAPVVRARGMVLDVEEMFALDPKIPALIEGILIKEGLIGIVGPSGSGKSFVGLSMALCMGAQIPWYGHATQSSGVLYIIGEGFAGYVARLRAWCDANRIDPAHFRGRMAFCRVPLDLTDEELCDRVFAELRDKAIAPDVLFLDTVSSNAWAGFDENQAKDMKRQFDRERALRDRFKMSIVNVHHMTHEGVRERGSTDFRASLDLLLFVKHEGDVRTLTLAKSRDLPPFAQKRFSLIPHLDSAVLEELAPRIALVEDEALTPSQMKVLMALAENWDGSLYPVADWKRESGYERTQFSQIRDELKVLGLIDGDRKGYVLTQGGTAAVQKIRDVRLFVPDTKRTTERQTLFGMSPRSIRPGIPDNAHTVELDFAPIDENDWVQFVDGAA